MITNIEIIASGFESVAGYRDEFGILLKGVEVNSVLDELGQEKVFQWIELSDYIDWAERKELVSEILDRLSPDEIINWLRDNGHLESEE